MRTGKFSALFTFTASVCKVDDCLAVLVKGSGYHRNGFVLFGK